jgi:hypothetical protein
MTMVGHLVSMFGLLCESFDTHVVVNGVEVTSASDSSNKAQRNVDFVTSLNTRSCKNFAQCNANHVAQSMI